MTSYAYPAGIVAANALARSPHTMDGMATGNEETVNMIVMCGHQAL